MTGGRHTERSTLASCLAQIVGAPVSEIPLDPEPLHAWLAGRGLGLVPIAGAASFAWAGPWIARRPDGVTGEPRHVVMFGVPSGVIWDPAGTTAGTILDGALVAPLDIAAWPPRPAGELPPGVVEAIMLAPAAEAPAHEVGRALAVPGRGLEGDRYAEGSGTFASGRPGSALTLVDADVLDELGAARGAPVDHRRNVVVRGADLNAMVGHAFAIGEVVCRGSRLCEPCAHLERLNAGGVLRPLVHRGGLRADIVAGGTLHVGDKVVARS
ncbi:MOSC domain-containing protein [Baekduia soli]|nr:MOSC domain-containing protein [Baekduia soli]